MLPRGTMRDIVTSSLPYWEGTRLWVIARPLSGFAETFSQYIVEVSPAAVATGPRRPRRRGRAVRCRGRPDAHARRRGARPDARRIRVLNSTRHQGDRRTLRRQQPRHYPILLACPYRAAFCYPSPQRFQSYLGGNFSDTGGRHSGIRYVTPAQRHAGQDGPVLAARHAVYQDARQRNPQRWSGSTRNWKPVGAVALNPERDIIIRAATSQIQLSGSIGEPAFPSRPGSAQATERNGGDGRSTATRSHAQRALSRASMARLASTGPSPQ